MRSRQLSWRPPLDVLRVPAQDSTAAAEGPPGSSPAEAGRLAEWERARRLAYVIISDLVAYEAEQIRLGLEKDDLFDRLGAEIERSRVFFLANVAADLPGRERLFNWALVDVLIAHNRAVRRYVW